MRLFTAIELPEDVRTHLARILNHLRNHRDLKDAVSLTKDDNLHITLKFLGDIPDDRVPALTTSLQTIPVPPMSLTVSHFLVFPGQGPARVLAANIAGDTKLLIALFNQIESAAQPLGIPRESREYKPHVTLGRFPRPNQKLTAQTLIKMIDPALLPAPTFLATSFTLFKSTLAPEGAIHTPIFNTNNE